MEVLIPLKSGKFLNNSSSPCSLCLLGLNPFEVREVSKLEYGDPYFYFVRLNPFEVREVSKPIDKASKKVGLS